jgi:hypothetical protein
MPEEMLPDLVITGIEYLEDAPSPQILVHYANRGGAKAEGFSLSRPYVQGVGPMIQSHPEYRKGLSLQPGEESSLLMELSPDLYGRYTISISIDEENTIREADETNNQFNKKIFIKQHSKSSEIAMLKAAFFDILLDMITESVGKIFDFFLPAGEFVSYLFKQKLYALIFRCPVNVMITDQYGRVIDDTGRIEIPRGEVQSTEELKVFYLPKGLAYTIKVEAYSPGSFSLSEIHATSNTTLSVREFKDIKVEKGTKATRVIKEGIEEQLMEIDYDGDGKVDREVTPSVTEISTKERAKWPLVPGGLIGIALLLIILAVKLYPRREVPVSRERICPKCGEVNRPDARFCKQCGAKL